jgi:hypothetical protein
MGIPSLYKIHEGEIYLDQMWLNIGRLQHHSKLPIPLSMITIAQINRFFHTSQNVSISPLVCVKFDFYPKIVLFNL